MHRSPLQGLDILEIGDEQFPASLEYDDKYDLEMVCAIHLCFSHYHSKVSGEDMLEFVKQKLGIRVGAGTGRSSVKRRPEDSDLWQGHNQIYTIRCDDTRKVNIDAYFVQRYDTRESWPTSPTDLRQRGRRVQKQQERLFYCWSEGELGKGDRGSSTTTILAYNPMASCPRSKLRSKINNEWFKSCITSYNEQEVVKSVDDKDIIRTFTAMTSRKGHLPCDCL
ncbi:uncharacterized protein [Aegilops tauschii subsp. strangulata]|uniref:uncharacterized protein isoform X1 n=1 Tax=Triticum aestivum TaxID=4565 RepID=UPI001D02BAD9|nr:uncharacterized protein LOC123119837 isoform X1 [Triticum aestivum]